jgi:hypothetical protein
MCQRCLGYNPPSAEKLGMDTWARWRRALLLNGAAAVGIVLALASRNETELDYGARAGVFVLAFMNFMFFVVRRRVLAARPGASTTTMSVFAGVIGEQPFILTIAVLLLVGSSRSAATAVSFAHWSGSTYVRGLPNASVLVPRMIMMSVLMAGIALLWFVDAVGLWARHPWAWWLALLLNGLAAGISLILQVSHWHTYLVDAFATVAVILLLLPGVRTKYLHPAASC